LFEGSTSHTYDDDRIVIIEGKNIGSLRDPDFLRDKIIGLGHSFDPEQLTPNRKNHTTVAKKQFNQMIDASRVKMAELVGKLTQKEVSWTQFQKQMQDTLRSMYTQAFTFGMRSTGSHQVLRQNNVPIITPNDQKWLQSAIKQEMGYWNRVLQQVRKGQLSGTQLDKRLDHYMGSTRSVYLSGRTMGTPNVYAIYWVLDRQAEHCDSCLYLRDHGPYHRYNLPTTPGAGQSKCLGNCKCRLMMVKLRADVLKPFLERSKSKDFHLRNLARIKNKTSTYKGVTPNMLKQIRRARNR
jgi:uncharacterized protein YnzC (UPF0291/DUF896 family)